jgi:hypothetical protein
MNYVIGIVLALATCGAALSLPRNRDRWFYPAMVVVIVLFDVLFAVMAGDRNALLLEAAILVAYVVMALLSYKFSLWLAVVALAAHGVFDLTHSLLFHNGGIPEWWPGFCMAFDVVAALFLCVLLVRRAQRLS